MPTLPRFPVLHSLPEILALGAGVGFVAALLRYLFYQVVLVEVFLRFLRPGHG